MSNVLPHVASRIYGRPLLLHPSTAALISANLGGRFGVAQNPDLASLTPGASRFRGAATDTGARYRVENGSAIVTVTGELCNRGAWIGASSGLTSYEGITAQIRAAVADHAVASIVLDLDTPGGEAVGAFECAAEIRAAAQAKPVTAFVNGMAASAGYALAAAANRIVVIPSGIVGSIGVVMLHVDRSRQLDKRGVVPTLIFAGDHKVDGHSFGPLPAGVQADLKAEVDKFYDLFVGTVARYRGMKTEAVRATQARCFMGADAVAARLADRVGTIEDALTPRSQWQPRGAVAASSIPAPPAQASVVAQTAAYVASCEARDRSATDALFAAAGSPTALPSPTITKPKEPLLLSKTPDFDTAAAWDVVVADLNAQACGLRGPSPSAAVPGFTPAATSTDALWSEVTAKLAAENGLMPKPAAGTPPSQTTPGKTTADLWDEAVGGINAANGVKPQPLPS